MNFHVVSHKFGDFCASRKQIHVNKSVQSSQIYARGHIGLKMIFDFEKVAGGFREVGEQNHGPPAPNEKAVKGVWGCSQTPFTDFNPKKLSMPFKCHFLTLQTTHKHHPSLHIAGKTGF